MTSSFFNYFGLFVIVLIFNSCCRSNKCKCWDQWHEDTEDCTPHSYGPYPLGGAKDYLYFKPGSFWVYKSNVSGELDTIKTVSCDSFVVESEGSENPWDKVTYTTIEFWLTSSTYRTDYSYFTYKTRPDKRDFRYTLALWRNALQNDCIAFYYPSDTHLLTAYCKVIPELKIGDSTYHDVLVYEGGKYDHTYQMPQKLGTKTSYDGNPSYYWARGRGLVMVECRLWRYDLQQSFMHRWELHQCKLIQ